MNKNFLEISAEVRYWEDTSVNGVEDVDGALIPMRVGKWWKPVINLKNGQIQNWPDGVVANVHYKVCDQGEYWILDDTGQRILKYKSDYAPDDYLSQIDCGYGDYIILEVDGKGFLKDWIEPLFKDEVWVKVI